MLLNGSQDKVWIVKELAFNDFWKDPKDLEYEDDLTLMFHSINHMQDKTQRLESTGLRINKDKTIILRVVCTKMTFQKSVLIQCDISFKYCSHQTDNVVLFYAFDSKLVILHIMCVHI